jgi:hypothetical protein
MKKKAKVAVSSELPKDFSLTDVSIPESPSPSIPEIDTDASLKIEEATTQTENLPEQEKHGLLLFVLGSIATLIIISGTVIFSVLYLRSSKTAVVPVSTAPTPTETPTPVIPNSGISFEVLNGSGVSGAAAKAGKQLETLGFKINSLGNAPDPREGITVYLAESLVPQKDSLMASIQKEFPTVAYAGVLTGSDSLARLVIGN